VSDSGECLVDEGTAPSCSCAGVLASCGCRCECPWECSRWRGGERPQWLGLADPDVDAREDGMRF